jgi:hypothetical protein
MDREVTVRPKPGTKLRCSSCPTEVVVIRGPEKDVSLTCGEGPLVGDADAAMASIQNEAHSGDAKVLLGKRYASAEVGIELLCAKAGVGPLACDGIELEVRAPQALPSSD